MQVHPIDLLCNFPLVHAEQQKQEGIQAISLRRLGYVFEKETSGILGQVGAQKHDGLKLVEQRGGSLITENIII